MTSQKETELHEMFLHGFDWLICITCTVLKISAELQLINYIKKIRKQQSSFRRQYGS